MYDVNFENPVYVRNMVEGRKEKYLEMLKKADRLYYHPEPGEESSLTDVQYDWFRGLLSAYNELEPDEEITAYLNTVGSPLN